VRYAEVWATEAGNVPQRSARLTQNIFRRHPLPLPRRVRPFLIAIGCGYQPRRRLLLVAPFGAAYLGLPRLGRWRFIMLLLAFVFGMEPDLRVVNGISLAHFGACDPLLGFRHPRSCFKLPEGKWSDTALGVI